MGPLEGDTLEGLLPKGNLFTLTRGFATVARTCSITESIVSPGRIRKLTTARPLTGKTFSFTPASKIVGAVVVRTIAFVAGLGSDRFGSVTVMKHIARQLKLWYPHHPNFLSTQEEFPHESAAPANFTLSQNYPNPFVGSTLITYSIPQDAQVRLAIYDLLGKEVEILERGQKKVGFYEASWDGRDKSGRLVPSGVYFYRLQVNHLQLTRKLFLVR